MNEKNGSGNYFSRQGLAGISTMSDLVSLFVTIPIVWTAFKEMR